MKKLLSVLLVTALVLSMVACGSKGNDNGTDANKDDVITAKVIDIELTQEEYAFGVDKAQPELLTKVNAFIAKIMDDGTFDKICDNYFGDGTPEGVKSGKQDQNNREGQLWVATNANFEPFEYKKGDTYYGVDMEIAGLLAKELGKELVVMDMEFDAVCLSVGQHKADIAMAGLTVKPDREEHVTFSTSYYNASQKIIVKSDNTEFDECKDAAAVEAILKEKTDACKIGVQSGTTAQFYCEGDADWDFEGFPVTTKGYQNGSLAVQDMLNGNVDYVIIDSAPAASISAAINEMR